MLFGDAAGDDDEGKGDDRESKRARDRRDCYKSELNLWHQKRQKEGKESQNTRVTTEATNNNKNNNATSASGERKRGKEMCDISTLHQGDENANSSCINSFLPFSLFLFGTSARIIYGRVYKRIQPREIFCGTRANFCQFSRFYDYFKPCFPLLAAQP